jgi:hypothetical protein
LGFWGEGGNPIPVFFFPKHCTLLVADMMVGDSKPSSSCGFEMPTIEVDIIFEFEKLA